jgi:hypothetical protein
VDNGRQYAHDLVGFANQAVKVVIEQFGPPTHPQAELRFLCLLDAMRFLARKSATLEAP